MVLKEVEVVSLSLLRYAIWLIDLGIGVDYIVVEQTEYVKGPQLPLVLS